MTTRTTSAFVTVVFLSAVAGAAYQGPPSKPREDLPSDKQRQQEEAVTQSGHEYTVDFQGAVDGAMTRMPISYKPYVQGWQPNVYCRMENVGDVDVVNPWITVNGRGDWRTLKGIVAEATSGCASEAEKARALWEFQRTHRFHATTWDAEASDAVKALNVYGYTLCGDEAQIIRDMFVAAGLRTRPGHPIGHAVTEAFYDGGFHLLDTDEHVICLLRDNKTIASEAEVVRDHDLMKRTHTYGISAQEDALTDQFSASLYYYTGERTGEGGIGTKHAMNFTLRPGEALEWRWSHVGKEYSGAVELRPGEAWTTDGTGTLRQLAGEGAYALMRNGKLIYRPPLDKAIYRKGIVAEENIACAAEDGGRGKLHPAKAGQLASITWRIASPYVLVGGAVSWQAQQLAEPDVVLVRWSSDGKTWQTPRTKVGGGYVVASLDELLSPRKKPMYEYFVKVEMTGTGKVALDSISFDNDVQMSCLGMPELTAGKNTIRYADDTGGKVNVKITHAWMERTAWKPPTAVKEAVFPKDGAEVEGTKFTFKWQEAQAGDAPTDALTGTLRTKIADYHIQVCDRQDMRWPLSPNFDKVISRTPSAGKCEWTVPFTGLFNPDTAYYWRVRAKDSNGVWGPWSKAFSFKCAAPAVPVNLKVVSEDGVPKAITWEDGPAGRKAVSWRVYGSNEQGFTASDVQHTVRAGGGFCANMAEFNKKKAPTKNDPFFGDVKMPPNVVAQTRERRLNLKDLAGPPSAFYRVAAVDGKGVESGPSDYVELPRPWIYTAPVVRAKAGAAYQYRPGAIASIGHLTCRGGYNAAFWERETLTWTLESGPAWLAVKDGELTGTPSEADAGAFDVALKVVNNKDGSAVQKFRLVIEK
ncbi:MAG: hypothetical protein ACE15C_06365 [Phycisphaerae bacterium]